MTRNVAGSSEQFGGGSGMWGVQWSAVSDRCLRVRTIVPIIPGSQQSVMQGPVIIESRSLNNSDWKPVTTATGFTAHATVCSLSSCNWNWSSRCWTGCPVWCFRTSPSCRPTQHEEHIIFSSLTYSRSFNSVWSQGIRQCPSYLNLFVQMQPSLETDAGHDFQKKVSLFKSSCQHRKMWRHAVCR